MIIFPFVAEQYFPKKTKTSFESEGTRTPGWMLLFGSQDPMCIRTNCFSGNAVIGLLQEDYEKT
ncbi:hypothetical protein HK23_12665 [Acetobacter malorum]|uniref:Uncharacterized protein n=1 Tax=Acetobacter malorum TaxID=178901 RepID=A0A1Y3G7X2_9PROT|nr:hypothetical protein HK23_12665 [Acetobacter malorum]